MPKTTATYDAQSIELLSGLEPVQKRPGMYTETTCPNHLAQEVIDNSVDEALAGHASEIRVVLYKDASLSVEDNGRGMPVDKHPKAKVSGVEIILTKLHAGAKFSDKAYQFSGGLHGVGVSVVNALSSTLTATIYRDGHCHQMQFHDGKPAGALKKTGTVPKRKTGTIIHFHPNKKYFDTVKFQVSRLKHILHAKAVLCPGLGITFENRQDGTEQTWSYQEGLAAYLNDETDIATIPELPIQGEELQNDVEMHWALTWVTEGSPTLTESYVNLVPTPQGGTHVNGFRSGLVEAIREFAEYRKMLPKGVKIAPEDVWDKVQFVLSVKMNNPQFAGQTKERLSSRDIASVATAIVKNHFGLWLHQHVNEGETITQMAIDNAQSRLRSSQRVQRKKVTQGPALPGKLSDCATSDRLQSELFLVEGDSAGGSAKQARNREFQAILPLKGKILNTWEVDSDHILASQEIQDIAIAIGVDPKSHQLETLRYGRICILADADSDGMHIQTLLCALFLRHFPNLVAEGHVYVAMPPLFRIDLGKEVHYALDDSEKESILAQIHERKPNAKPVVQRFKGLGEMNPKQLRETTMAPDTRRLVQLTLPEKTDTAHQLFDMLLAKKRAGDRKHWLESKGDAAEVHQN